MPQSVMSLNPKYLLPINDQDEIHRLDHQHYMIRHLVHGNFQAPIEDRLENGVKVLDAGCGSGRWVLDMAMDYPKSCFVGSDVASVNMSHSSDLPPNVTFVQADTLKGLPFPDNTFDYTYQRFMVVAFSPADWVVAIKELIRVTKPGGWIELFEADFRLNRGGPSFEKLFSAINTASSSRGIDLIVPSRLKELAGNLLEDVEWDYVSVPYGWHGRDGEIGARSLLMEYKAMGSNLAPILDLNDEDYADLVEAMGAELQERRTWGMLPYLYGRKPEGDPMVA